MAFNTHLHGNKCCNNNIIYKCHLMILFKDIISEKNTMLCFVNISYYIRPENKKKKSLALDNILRTKIKIWFLGKNQIASSHIPHR